MDNIDACIENYLNEFDYKYTINQPTVDPVFKAEITNIIETICGVIVAGKVICDCVKKELDKRKEKKTQELLAQRKTIPIFENGSVLYYSNTRPFFDIPTGSRLYFYKTTFTNKLPNSVTPFKLDTPLQIPNGVDLVLQDVIIVYDGDLGKFIKEEIAPSVFLIEQKYIVL